jgi:NAD(P)-dependent dehydrogenase (short-subunit alcohol dehydrogenase family)
MREAIPHMRKVGGGSIINMASLAGVVCPPGSPAYSAAKAGLIQLTKQVALDFGKDGIRCNVVCPGPIRTAMLDGAVGPMAEALGTDLDDVYGRLSKSTALRRAGRPDEIAGICVYLAGADSSFMTGSTIMVDGGTHYVDVFAAAVGDLGLSFA